MEGAGEGSVSQSSTAPPVRHTAGDIAGDDVEPARSAEGLEEWGTVAGNGCMDAPLPGLTCCRQRRESMKPIEALDHAILMAGAMSIDTRKPGAVISRLRPEVREKLKELTSEEALKMRLHWIKKGG